MNCDQIYDKSLKRKDFSGVIDKDKGHSETKTSDAKATPKKSKDANVKDNDDPKAGADIGKIVQLFSSDAVCSFTNHVLVGS